MRLLTLLVLCTSALLAQASVRFRVTLAKEGAAGPVSGRLIVFLSDSPQPQEYLSAGFEPKKMWVASREVESIAPGESVIVDPAVEGYPSLAASPRGAYQAMALLDTDHDYAYTGPGDPADIYGPVVKLDDLDPAGAQIVDLQLTKRAPAREAKPLPERVKAVVFESPVLTAFWGRPIAMRAVVVLPADYDTATAKRYAAAYHVHGFGGNYDRLLARAGAAAREYKDSPLVHVLLDGSFSTGHHEFADSLNNGPWGRALTQEFIPYLEKQFRLSRKGAARYLTGHSSGGWSTLWLQVTYPDFFGGTWSTAPDPVDFRSFSGVNVTPGSNDNMYRKPDGGPHGVIRVGGKDVVRLEDFARQEEVLGEYGGQLASFEYVFSPKGPDGRPERLFNRATGDLDPEVEKAWEKYDIRLKLDREWAALAPKLKGKVNVICGTEDTFHLEEAVSMLCDFFKQKGSDAVCELVPGRNHSDLFRPYVTYPEGLEKRIEKEMQAKAAGL